MNRAEPDWGDPNFYLLKELLGAIRASVKAAPEISEGSVVLDFGCGDQPYRSLFEEKGARYLAADLKDAEVPIIPGKPLPLADGTCDVVLSFQVLEHVEDVSWYLDEAFRVLKEDGLLLLSTHGSWPYHPHPKDLRRWTRQGLCHDVEQHGFAIRKVAPLVGLLAWTLMFRLKGYSHVLSQLGWPGKGVSRLLSTATNMRIVLEDAVTPRRAREENAAVYLIEALKKRRSWDKKR